MTIVEPATAFRSFFFVLKLSGSTTPRGFNVAAIFLGFSHGYPNVVDVWRVVFMQAMAPPDDRSAYLRTSIPPGPGIAGPTGKGAISRPPISL